MNKAFIKETETEFEEDHETTSIPAGVKNYITVRGFAALRAEYMQLLDEERPKVVEAVALAASNGDRSENADYYYGKKRLREIDRRLRFLSKRIDQAQVIDPAEQPQKHKVYFGARIRYASEQGQTQTITIVGIDEADPLAYKISWVAPIARALIGSSVGDEVSFQSPAGEQMIEVLAIDYPE